MSHLLSSTKNYQNELHQYMRNSHYSLNQGDEIVRISIVPVSKKEKGFKLCVSVKSGNCTKSFKVPLLEETQEDHMLM